MNATSRRRLAGAALMPALLAGCDAGEVLGPDDSDVDPTIAEQTDGVAPEAALSVGETFEGAASTTVKQIVRREGAESWAPAGVDYEWVSARVRTCVPASGSATEVGWYQWAVVGADGGWYPADLDYDQPLPTGQYPRLADLAPGDCAGGRILIAVPRDAEVVTLINSDEAGMPQGTWLIGDIGVPAAADGQ